MHACMQRAAAATRGAPRGFLTCMSFVFLLLFFFFFYPSCRELYSVLNQFIADPESESPHTPTAFVLLTEA
jgi:hypothetical protein